MIDRHNHHLFQPLLYQVATADLSPADIAAPIRSILRGQPQTSVILAEVKGVDLQARRVLLANCAVPFDYLVIATGAHHSYFGHEEWAPFAPGIKSLDDAALLRRKLLLAFEAAEIEPDPQARQALLTFVLVGAGPTGVELAGALAELANTTLARDFRAIDPASARILLVEAAPRILQAFPEPLANQARQALARRGVEVRTETLVEAIDEEGVVWAWAYMTRQRSSRLIICEPASACCSVSGASEGKAEVLPARTPDGAHLSSEKRLVSSS